MYCPWWANWLWRSAELKGAMTVWEAGDMEYYPGLGRVVTEFQGALAEADSNARMLLERKRERENKR